MNGRRINHTLIQRQTCSALYAALAVWGYARWGDEVESVVIFSFPDTPLALSSEARNLGEFHSRSRRILYPGHPARALVGGAQSRRISFTISANFIYDLGEFCIRSRRIHLQAALAFMLSLTLVLQLAPVFQLAERAARPLSVSSKF